MGTWLWILCPCLMLLKSAEASDRRGVKIIFFIIWSGPLGASRTLFYTKSVWEVVKLLISVCCPYRGMAEMDCNARCFGQRGKEFELFLFILSFGYVPSCTQIHRKCIAVQKNTLAGTSALKFCWSAVSGRDPPGWSSPAFSQFHVVTIINADCNRKWKQAAYTLLVCCLLISWVRLYFNMYQGRLNNVRTSINHI